MITPHALLYVPADQPRLVAKALSVVDTDAVVLDLEDGVPVDAKPAARANARACIRERRAWVRINEAETATAAEDCEAIAGLPNLVGVRIPKVENAAQVEWVANFLPAVPLICGIESARGLLEAARIAVAPQVLALSLGGVDFLRALGVEEDSRILTHLRVQLVLASAAAGVGKPIDRVYPFPRDLNGLRKDALTAKALGFGGKSALSPRQFTVIRSVFQTTHAEVSAALAVLDAFAQSQGQPTTTADGVFVDLPVARRATELLERAGVSLPPHRP